MDTAELIAALEAPTPDRRPLMAQLEHEAPEPALAGALASAKRPLTRQLAADILGRRAAAAAGPALMAALQDVDPGVRGAAADAAGKVLMEHGPASVPEAGPELVAAFEAEPDPGVRALLAAALGAAGYREAIPLLRAAAQRGDRGLELTARWALERLGDPQPE